MEEEKQQTLSEVLRAFDIKAELEGVMNGHLQPIVHILSQLSNQKIKGDLSQDDIVTFWQRYDCLTKALNKAFPISE